MSFESGVGEDVRGDAAALVKVRSAGTSFGSRPKTVIKSEFFVDAGPMGLVRIDFVVDPAAPGGGGYRSIASLNEARLGQRGPRVSCSCRLADRRGEQGPAAVSSEKTTRHRRSKRL